MLFHIKINQSLQSCQVNSAIKWRNSSHIFVILLSLFFFFLLEKGVILLVLLLMFFLVGRMRLKTQDVYFQRRCGYYQTTFIYVKTFIFLH